MTKQREFDEHQSRPGDVERRRAVVCLSGGMDSTSLLLHLLADDYLVYGLSFDYGQKHKIELERLGANLEYLSHCNLKCKWDLVDLEKMGELFHSALVDPDWQVPQGYYKQDNMKETVVPNRNAIFASIAYGYALSIAGRDLCEVKLAMGVHSGDHSIYPDCRPEFYSAIHHAFTLGNWDSERVSLYLPYLEMDKLSILNDADRSIQKLGLDFERVFRNTCSSYQPDSAGRSHGLTGSDVERILAFHEFGTPDPVEYRDSWETVVSEALRLKKDFESGL